MPDNGLNVLSLMDEYADQENISVGDIFKPPTSSKPQPDDALPQIPPSPPTPPSTASTDGMWRPKAELLEDMPEVGRSASFEIDPEKFQAYINDGPKGSMMDDLAMEAALSSADELHRAQLNISAAKRRLGVGKLNIPTLYTAKIMDAAGDTDRVRSATRLDELFQEIFRLFPESVLERDVDAPPIPAPIPSAPKMIPNTDGTYVPYDETPVAPAPVEGESAQVIINKSQVNEVHFDAEELEKLRKARTIELNIVENMDLQYTQIEDVDDNVITRVLNQYTRKTNDIAAAIPASKFRGTFTGLSYTDVMDLNQSLEISSLDQERKKWDIIFRHIKNQSIGSWVARDVEIPEQEPMHISEFDDFLMKVSFLDMDYMLWLILCATCMDREIVSITCAREDCKTRHDWPYSPRALLVEDSISDQVRHELKLVTEADSLELINKYYSESMLNTNNAIILPSSGFTICFGHASAYTYLNSLFGIISAIRRAGDNAQDSSYVEMSALSTIKYFLLPKENGEGHYRVKSPNSILKIVRGLDELDIQTISKISDMMVKPYSFKFEMKDIICPTCKTKVSIPISNMAELLFIIAQSLASVNVTLKTS